MEPNEQEILCIMDQYHIALNSLKELEEMEIISESIRIDKEIELEELYTNAMKILFYIGYGMVFTINNFIAEVGSGCISNYDGHGIICDENGNEGEEVTCDVEWLRNNCAGYKYVIWFNK